MKPILILFFSLIYFAGQGQELRTLTEIELGEVVNNKLNLGQELSVSIEPDSEWIFHIIEFERNNNVELIDSVDLAADGFNTRLLKLSNKRDLLFIIEAIYEYVSYYPVYIIQKNEIKKIGILNIRLDCNDCDALNYPLNEIIIKGNGDKIEFTFKQDLVLMDKKNFPKFKKDEIRFVYEFGTEKLKIEKSTGANTQYKKLGVK